MDYRLAYYHTVHDHGVEAVAAFLGKRADTVRHEARPPAGSTAKLGLVDAVKTMDFTGDLRTLDAINAHFRSMRVPLPDMPDSTGEVTLDLVQRLVGELSELTSAMVAAEADRQVTDNELINLKRQAGELVAVTHKVVEHFSARNQAGKPALVVAAQPVRAA